MKLISNGYFSCWQPEPAILVVYRLWQVFHRTWPIGNSPNPMKYEAPSFPLTYIIPFPQPYPLDSSLIIASMLHMFHTLEYVWKDMEYQCILWDMNWESTWSTTSTESGLNAWLPGTVRIVNKNQTNMSLCWGWFKRNINNFYCRMFLAQTETMCCVLWDNCVISKCVIKSTIQ